MPKSIFENVFSLLFKRGAKIILNRITKGVSTPSPEPSANKTTSSKVHPWRLCPVGEHWVTPHPLTVPVSKKNPDGITTRNTGCRKNPLRGSSKRFIQDYLHPHEIEEIAKTHFPLLLGPPTKLKLAHENSDDYDHLIRGWTKYWNEVFQPKYPLDPDLVKALIASESGFRLNPPEPNAGAAGRARGLLQLTDQAIGALKDPKGELSDHLIEMTQSEASDPNIAICAGIRWLFRKKDLAARRLKREATWVEAVAEYKDYLRDIVSGKNPNPEAMKRFGLYCEDLKR